jgi:hypothetical protein
VGCICFLSLGFFPRLRRGWAFKNTNFTPASNHLLAQELVRRVGHEVQLAKDLADKLLPELQAQHTQHDGAK